MVYHRVACYLLKSCEPNELKDALSSINKNGVCYSKIYSNKLTQLLAKKESLLNITNSQVELLQYICKGLSYREIAEKMKIQLRSVEGKKDVLAKKLNIRSKEGLIMFAIKAGIVQLD